MGLIWGRDAPRIPMLIQNRCIYLTNREKVSKINRYVFTDKLLLPAEEGLFLKLDRSEGNE